MSDYINKGKRAIEFRSEEGEQRQVDSMNTIEYREKLPVSSELALSDKEVRKKISDKTKEGWAKRQEKVSAEKERGKQKEFEVHNLGDTCYGKELGFSSSKLMIWTECPNCKAQRWAQVIYVNKLCGDCNRKDEVKRSKISKTLTGKKRDWSPSTEHIDIIKKTLTGKKHTPEHIEGVRQAALKQWATPETRDRLIKAILEVRSPNKVEIKVLNWLNEQLGNEWKFVGDGQIIIGGCCPDFINTNGKKLIVEFYGDFFHKPEDEGYKKKLYAKFGYDTFAIWSKDIQNHTNRALLFDRLKEWDSGRIGIEDTQMVFEL
jgi:hypothetical protein